MDQRTIGIGDPPKNVSQNLTQASRPLPPTISAATPALDAPATLRDGRHTHPKKGLIGCRITSLRNDYGAGHYSVSIQRLFGIHDSMHGFHPCLNFLLLILFLFLKPLVRLFGVDVDSYGL